MARKKVKIVRIENQKSREICLKKRSLGLQKMVKELTILCDVKACVAIFSPDEAEPMVWPSVEATCNLLHEYFALPDIMKKKNETGVESYIKEKTRKVDDQLMKLQEKNKKSAVDQLMVQLHNGRTIDELSMSEIYDMISFSRAETMLIRKELNFKDPPPLCEPPMNPFEEFRTTTDDVLMGGDQDGEGVTGISQTDKRICIGAARENQTRYLMDQWFFTSPESSNFNIHHQFQMEIASVNANENLMKYLPYRGSSSHGNSNLEMESSNFNLHQQIHMEIASVNANENHMKYLPYRGSSSHGNSNLEMEPFGSPMVGPISQPSYHHRNMNQPRQYHFDSIRGINEEQININNDDSQFPRSINNVAMSDAICHETISNPTGPTTQEDKADAIPFDINMFFAEL